MRLCTQTLTTLLDLGGRGEVGEVLGVLRNLKVRELFPLCHSLRDGVPGGPWTWDSRVLPGSDVDSDRSHSRGAEGAWNFSLKFLFMYLVSLSRLGWESLRTRYPVVQNSLLSPAALGLTVEKGCDGPGQTGVRQGS